MAAIQITHKLSGLEQQKFIVSVLEATKFQVRCGQGHAPEDANEDYVSLFSPKFGNLRHISYVSRWASFCIHLCLTFPFNKDTGNFGLGQCKQALMHLNALH